MARQKMAPPGLCEVGPSEITTEKVDACMLVSEDGFSNPCLVDTHGPPGAMLFGQHLLNSNTVAMSDDQNCFGSLTTDPLEGKCSPHLGCASPAQVLQHIDAEVPAVQMTSTVPNEAKTVNRISSGRFLSDEPPSPDMLRSFAVASQPRNNSLFKQLMGRSLPSSSQSLSGPEQPKWIASSFHSINSYQEEHSNLNQAPYLVPSRCDTEAPENSACSDQCTSTGSQHSLPNVAKINVRNTFIEAFEPEGNLENTRLATSRFWTEGGCSRGTHSFDPVISIPLNTLHAAPISFSSILEESLASTKTQ